MIVQKIATTKSKSAGFTLISLLVGIGVFGLISLALASMFVNVLKIYNSQKYGSDLQAIIATISRKVDCCNTFNPLGATATTVGSITCTDLNADAAITKTAVGGTHDGKQTIVLRSQNPTAAENRIGLDEPEGIRVGNWYYWAECENNLPPPIVDPGTDPVATRYIKLSFSNSTDKDTLSGKDLTALKEYVPAIKLCSHLLNSDVNLRNYHCAGTGIPDSTYIGP